MSPRSPTALGWLVAGASLHDAIITGDRRAHHHLSLRARRSRSRPCRSSPPGALFRAGVLLNAGDAIERLADIDTVVFDKTGTLTLPEPRVVNAARIDPDLLETRGAARAVEPSSARHGAGP